MMNSAPANFQACSLGQSLPSASKIFILLLTAGTAFCTTNCKQTQNPQSLSAKTYSFEILPSDFLSLLGWCSEAPAKTKTLLCQPHNNLENPVICEVYYSHIWLQLNFFLVYRFKWRRMDWINHVAQSFLQICADPQQRLWSQVGACFRRCHF